MIIELSRKTEKENHWFNLEFYEQSIDSLKILPSTRAEWLNRREGEVTMYCSGVPPSPYLELKSDWRMRYTYLKNNSDYNNPSRLLILYTTLYILESPLFRGAAVCK